MDVQEAREKIKAVVASGNYTPQRMEYINVEGDEVFGCALCALYLGCGGLPKAAENTVAPQKEMREFLSKQGVDFRDVCHLEAGFEGFVDMFGIDKVDLSSPWYQLGQDLRRCRL